MLAATAMVACPEYSDVWAFVRGRQTRPTPLRWQSLPMVQHGICPTTMKYMLLARTRFLAGFFREAFSIPVNRSFRPRAGPGCSTRFLVPLPKTNRRVDTALGRF